MFEVRIHGRGGQGVVTAADMLSVAAFLEGRHAQAFPFFGSERFGAPVVAFCRVSDAAIRSREPISEPDVLIIQDATLMHQPGVLAGLKRGGYVVVNSGREASVAGVERLAEELPPGHLTVVPATALAMTHVHRPVPNAALLGAFAALTGWVSLDAVEQAIREKFPAKVAEGNVAAAREAASLVRTETREPTHA